jgi:hypothetical protein
LVRSNSISILNVINKESFVNTPISVTGIADSIQQQFATSHTKITRYLHHMHSDKMQRNTLKQINNKVNVHGSVHRNIQLIERTNNRQPGSGIYYSGVS